MEIFFVGWEKIHQALYAIVIVARPFEEMDNAKLAVLRGKFTIGLRLDSAGKCSPDTA
jgi:hypothetical protein